MSIFLVLVAILIVGATAFFAVGRNRAGNAPASVREPGVVPGLVEPTPTLPPVLLPENPTADDVGRIRFSLGLRGYRMDQVDEVLDRLASALEERDELITVLREKRSPGQSEVQDEPQDREEESP
ncbi:DivIVA domain-containing protein [Arthrobacter pigmenti]|uniref:DivIVA domain-containing protein n=1 Tax=Arthrobacter pigmenti TaxID=271432 RepID=A0A846RN30_9MICC|nr:DivIVA domain-containing protein [Arthrobacter pigmenti]NJC23020.1 DivIVA domain-containing protein [Arthrobacter pigmenti]